MTRGGGGVRQKVILYDKGAGVNEFFSSSSTHVFFFIISRAVVSLKGHYFMGILTNLRGGQAKQINILCFFLFLGGG